MFTKTFLVAVILCACLLGSSLARPQLPGLDVLPLGALTGAAGAAGAATGGLLGAAAGGGLTQKLPLLNQGGGLPKIL